VRKTPGTKGVDTNAEPPIRFGGSVGEEQRPLALNQQRPIRMAGLAFVSTPRPGSCAELERSLLDGTERGRSS